jgi:AcrR family transcriptional regulator
VFNKSGVAEIPSTTSGGEMSDTEHGGQNVRLAATNGAAVPDRRVRRTRKLLHDAFLSLVIDKGYEKTTIQDILDRADIGRSTFYVHYRDKEALLTASFDGMREQLQSELADIPSAGVLDVTLPATLLFEHAYRNQRVYRALCGHQGGALVQRYLRRVIGDLLRERLKTPVRHADTAAHAAVPADVAAAFYTSATLGLLVWWIDQDFSNGPDWLAAKFRALARPGH